MVSTTIAIIQKENIFGLWRGITPVCILCIKYQIQYYNKNMRKKKTRDVYFFGFQSMTRVIPGVGLYFSTLHWLTNTLDLDDPITPLQAVTLGITARTISGALLIPITVVKTRYEVCTILQHQ